MPDLNEYAMLKFPRNSTERWDYHTNFERILSCLTLFSMYGFITATEYELIYERINSWLRYHGEEEL